MGRTLAFALAGFLTLSAVALAQQANVVGLAYEPLDLFPSTDESADPVGSLTASDLSFPVAIKGASDNGMLLITVGGEDVWVIAADVETDRKVDVGAGCEPEMQGATVSFGARGLGEGCK